MSKVILWHDPIKDRLCVTMPSYNDRTRPPGATEDEFIARVIAKAVPAGVSTRLVDDTDPGLQDRTFRNALEDTGVAVEVNMPKARDLQMNYIRRVRNAELLRLDEDFLRALEDDDVVERQRIVGRKRILRDIPQTFDLSVYATPEELKTAWPVEIPRPAGEIGRNDAAKH